MGSYANGVWTPVDARLRSQVMRVLNGYTFTSLPYLDKDAIQTLSGRDFCAMAKVKGVRTLVVMVVDEITGAPRTVLFDRTGTMRHIMQLYQKFVPNTILDGVVTLEAVTVDGDIYDGDNWIFLFFDVILYGGHRFEHALRQCLGALFHRNIHVGDADCFVWRWQQSYPIQDFTAVFKNDANAYNVEGVVFKNPTRLIKWNFPAKRRCLLRIRGRQWKDNKIQLDLLAEDNTVVGNYSISPGECVRTLLRHDTLPLMECIWHHSRWKTAKLCADHDAAHSVTELASVKKATVDDITIDDIQLHIT